MRYAFLNYLGLIGNEIGFDIRRQNRSKTGEGLLDPVAEIDDIFPLLHFDGEHHAGLAVIANQERGSS